MSPSAPAVATERAVHGITCTTCVTLTGFAELREQSPQSDCMLANLRGSEGVRDVACSIGISPGAPSEVTAASSHAPSAPPRGLATRQTHAATWWRLLLRSALAKRRGRPTSDAVRKNAAPRISRKQLHFRCLTPSGPAMNPCDLVPTTPESHDAGSWTSEIGSLPP